MANLARCEASHGDHTEPPAHGMGGEVAAIIAAYVIGQTMTPEQLGKRSQDTIALWLALGMDRQTLPAVVVDQ
tara:strand:- start:423 stop:641 length:219 start_codon:yes stop_codon:yes gene_type:complete